MTNSQKFKEAWRISRIAFENHGGLIKQYFAEALRLVNKHGKVSCLTIKEKYRVLNCFGGTRILNWSSEYISDTETKIFAKTIRNRKVSEKYYYFDHNRTDLTVIKN
jgi:hypothetical protein